MGNPALSRRARALIEDVENERLLSIASIWEIAIKSSLGKLQLARPFSELIPIQLERNSISLLPITFEHTSIVAQLDLYHRDPFDRMLVAQSIVERLPVVSGDEIFDHYPVRHLW